MTGPLSRGSTFSVVRPRAWSKALDSPAVKLFRPSRTVKSVDANLAAISEYDVGEAGADRDVSDRAGAGEPVERSV